MKNSLSLNGELLVAPWSMWIPRPTSCGVGRIVGAGVGVANIDAGGGVAWAGVGTTGLMV